MSLLPSTFHATATAPTSPPTKYFICEHIPWKCTNLLHIVTTCPSSWSCFVAFANEQSRPVWYRSQHTVDESAVLQTIKACIAIFFILASNNGIGKTTPDQCMTRTTQQRTVLQEVRTQKYQPDKHAAQCSRLVTKTVDNCLCKANTSNSGKWCHGFPKRTAQHMVPIRVVTGVVVETPRAYSCAKVETTSNNLNAATIWTLQHLPDNTPPLFLESFVVDVMVDVMIDKASVVCQ